MKPFNVFEIKSRLDQERYERNKDRKISVSEKIVKVVVVLAAALILSSAISILTWPVLAKNTFYGVMFILVVLRAFQVFKPTV